MGTQQTNAAELRAGLIEAARELGHAFDVYRPNLTPVNGVVGGALLLANKLRTTVAAFPRNYTYKQAIDPLKPQRVAVLDSAAVQPGDYLFDGTETYFIGNMEPLLPIYAVVCNRVVSLNRQQDVTRGQPTRVGDVGQLGNVSVGMNTSEFTALTNWPASVLYSGRGSKPLSGLPSDDTAAQWTILLPKLPLVIAPADIITDDLARRYVVVSAEENAGGTRLITNQAIN